LLEIEVSTVLNTFQDTIFEELAATVELFARGLSRSAIHIELGGQNDRGGALCAQLVTHEVGLDEIRSWAILAEKRVKTFVESNRGILAFVQRWAHVFLENVLDHGDLQELELDEMGLFLLGKQHADTGSDVGTTTLTENANSFRVNLVLSGVGNNVFDDGVSILNTGGGGVLRGQSVVAVDHSAVRLHRDTVANRDVLMISAAESATTVEVNETGLNCVT